jgi:hypothetical protein
MIKDQGIVVEVEDSVGWCILRNLNVESCWWECGWAYHSHTEQSNWSYH